MLSIILSAALVSSQANELDNPRLKERISIREEIVSLRDLAGKLSAKTGVQIKTSNRVADRKMTIAFSNRPASEAMESVAKCMFSEWKKDGNGYLLDLTAKSAAAEARTEALEREMARQGLRSAIKEIRALYALNPSAREAEMTKVDDAYAAGRKAGEAPDTPAMQLLNLKASALHNAGFIEVVGPALAAARLNREGDPEQKRWFASADKEDGVGWLDPKSLRARRAEENVDALGIINFSEDERELQTVLFQVSDPGGSSTTSVGNLRIPVSNLNQRSELEKLMAEWSVPLPDSIKAKKIDEAAQKAEPSDFCTGTYGRGRHLLNLADRSGLPIVADAFRRSLSAPRWIPGSSVAEWLEGYAKGLKTAWNAPPDHMRAENGWLLVREDHWWWKLKSEIPEAILLPLEELSSASRMPLPLTEYVRLASKTTGTQLRGLRHPESLLLRFPIGNLSSASSSLRLFALCSPSGRDEAWGAEGAGLAELGDEARTIAEESILSQAIANGDLTLMRRIIRRDPSLLDNWRLFAEDESAKDRSDVNVAFTLGKSVRSTLTQRFTCKKGLP